MAPFVGPGQKRVLEILEGRKPAKHLPITLGSGSPEAVIDRFEGNWELRRLVLDQQAADRAGREAIARGDIWMPEMQFRFIGPAPEADVSAPDAAGLAEKLRAIPWRWGGSG
jgi:hypothetical protein